MEKKSREERYLEAVEDITTKCLDSFTTQGELKASFRTRAAAGVLYDCLFVKMWEIVKPQQIQANDTETGNPEKVKYDKLMSTWTTEMGNLLFQCLQPPRGGARQGHHEMGFPALYKQAVVELDSYGMNHSQMKPDAIDRIEEIISARLEKGELFRWE